MSIRITSAATGAATSMAATTPLRPVVLRANLRAASVLSVPELQRKTRFKPSGARLTSVSISCPRWSLKKMPGQGTSVCACSAKAWATAGVACPTLATPTPEAQSRYAFP